MKPFAAAAREAREEAGLVGKVAKVPIGSYRYEKRLKTGTTVICEVEVFPLEVRRQRRNFREKDQREPRWVVPAVAADLVDEPALGALIRAFARQLEPGPAPTPPVDPGGPKEPIA